MQQSVKDKELILEEKSSVKQKKVFVKTYGCQMNEYDSDKIEEIFVQNANYTITATPDNADVIIFNTCSIREKAQEKVFSDLGRVKHLKQNDPNVIIGVGGCVASQEGDTIVKRAPYVDIVFGPQTLHRVLELIEKKQVSGKPQVDISFPEIEKFDNIPKQKNSSVSAFVSIMEGCSKYCSYCVVPYTRGEEVSRSFDSVINEIRYLASIGIKEVNLLGQNVNAYRGEMSDGTICDFAFLIEYIDKIDGIERIRYTTSHPTEMTERIIQCYANIPKLVSHLHLPVQSGSDRILSLMKRGYTALQYKDILRRIKKLRPDISFSSDFIVGFPGETEEDFLKTLRLAEEIGFDDSFSFVFSARPGTPAANIQDETPNEVKLNRLHRLQSVLGESAAAITKSMVGGDYPVLVESYSENNGMLSGRTANMKVVHFSGDKSLIGRTVNVNVTSSGTHTLRGNKSEG
jgi:tRNA-2-methylthio-N6-dimethylallyladenosine synthase